MMALFAFYVAAAAAAAPNIASRHGRVPLPKAAKIQPQVHSVALVALGCPKNTVDAEVMLGDLQQRQLLGRRLV